MSSEVKGEYRGKVAGEDLSDSQYFFTTLESDNTVDLADATTDYVYGVVQNAPESGLEANVKVYGHTKVVAGAAIAIGEFVAPTAAGKAQVAVEGQYVAGQCVKAAGDDLDYAEIELINSVDDIGGADTFTTITFTAGGGLVFATSGGSTIGAAANQLFAFWGATAVAQPTHNADPASQGAMVAAGPSKTAATPDAITVTTPTAQGAMVAAGPSKTAANPDSITGAGVGDLVATNNGWGASSEVNFDKIWAAIDANVADILSIHTQLTAAIVDIDDNNSEIDNLILDVGELDGGVDNNKAAIDENIADILSIHTQLSAAIVDIDDNNSEIDNLILDVGELDGGVDNNNAVIDEINADFATLGLTAAS